MKLTVTDKALFERLQRASIERERFTLTGRGVTAEYAGVRFTHTPGPGHSTVELELEQLTRAESAVPPPWNGEGLPPVGLEVETVCSGIVRRVKILAITDQNIFMRQIEDNREWLFNRFNPGSRTFRPIRTAEQIAAEEKKAEIDAMFTVVIETEPNIRAGVEALYDAGYRKVEK